MKRTKLDERTLPTYTKGEEIFNMTSHIVGGALGIVALVLCVIFAAIHHNPYGVVASSIFGVTIGNGVKTTSPNNVEKEMSKLMDWYNSLNQITIKEIIEFHYKFESIHPFQDGNGRIGRIIMFKECLKNNIVPFIIQDADKLFYYRGLREYKSEKGYLTDTCLNAQDQYIKMIEYYLK